MADRELTRRRPRPVLAALAALTAAAPVLVAGACSDDDGVTVGKSEDLGLTGAAKAGQAVVDANACSACHSTNGSERVGPTWKGLWGSTVTLSDGKQVTVDRAYVKRSIREPSAQRREGATGTMPAYGDDRITDDQIDDLVAFLKALK